MGGTGTDCTKLRSWKPTRAECHCASKKRGKRSSFDPENYLQLLPIMTAKLRLSRRPSMPSKPWRIV